MTTIQLSKKQLENISVNLNEVAKIALEPATETEGKLCSLYMDLCEAIAQGIVVEGSMIMVGKEESHGDTLDRAERHSVSGHMNDPSEMQKLAFEKETKDDI